MTSLTPLRPRLTREQLEVVGACVLQVAGVSVDTCREHQDKTSTQITPGVEVRGYPERGRITDAGQEEAIRCSGGNRLAGDRTQSDQPSRLADRPNPNADGGDGGNFATASTVSRAT